MRGLATFGPSFVAGKPILQFGKDRIVIAGMAVLIDCMVVTIPGLSLGHFWIAFAGFSALSARRSSRSSSPA